jgi:TPR repeat protein
MYALGTIHCVWKEFDQAVGWFTKGAEAGLPDARYDLGCCLDEGEGVATPDCLAAADWYRHAADAGHGSAAHNLSTMYTLGRGRA